MEAVMLGDHKKAALDSALRNVRDFVFNPEAAHGQSSRDELQADLAVLGEAVNELMDLRVQLAAFSESDDLVGGAANVDDEPFELTQEGEQAAKEVAIAGLSQAYRTCEYCGKEAGGKRIQHGSNLYCGTACHTAATNPIGACDIAAIEADDAEKAIAARSRDLPPICNALRVWVSASGEGFLAELTIATGLDIQAFVEGFKVPTLADLHQMHRSGMLRATCQCVRLLAALRRTEEVQAA